MKLVYALLTFSKINTHPPPQLPGTERERKMEDFVEDWQQTYAFAPCMSILQIFECEF
jgi:hypothetical protein